MAEKEITIEAARFIRESIPGVKLYEIGNDLTDRTPATSANFKRVAQAHDFIALTTNDERRFIVRKKSLITKSIKFPHSVVVPEVHNLASGYQIFEIPSDSVYVDFYNIDNLAFEDKALMVSQIIESKHHLIATDRSIVLELKKKYGKDIKLEDFLTSSVVNSSIIFLG